MGAQMGGFTSARESKPLRKEEAKMKKRMTVSILIIVATVGITLGGVLAFFSDIDSTPTNRFTGGVVNIRANEILIPEPWEIEDWTPGDPVDQIYEIKNNGTVPIFLRSSFIGSWTPLTSVTGQHKNTATVTATYEGQVVTDQDSAHYYVNVSNP